MQVHLTKKSASKGVSKARAAGAGAAPVVAFNLQDNGDETFTVLGVDAAGNQLDISSLATLSPAPTSDNSAVVTVDPPVGMGSAIHAAVPAPTPGATANITVTATFNDGSIGPFVITWPITVVAGGPTGIMIQPGTPSVH